MRLLVVGASGYLGAEVSRLAVAAGWSVTGTFHRAAGDLPGVRWRALDVRDRAAVAALVAEVAPDAVVNTAYAFTDWATCADGAAHVAVAARSCGARLVHLSSDAVFAGRPEPYTEDDVPSPVYPYGAAKAAAETAVRAVDPGAVVVRTSLIVGDGRSAQHQMVLGMVDGRIAGVLFRDQIRCPVAVEDLAGAVVELAASDVAGPLNVAGPEAVSRYQLGRLVAAHHGLDPDAVPAGTSAEAGMRSPGEVRLDVTRAAGLLGTRLRGVTEVLTP